MMSSWIAILVKCKYEPRFFPILLALLRIGICFWPQTGYLHPDEFFQSTDITAGKYFDSKILPSWEFKTEQPIRCMLIPNVLNYLAFSSATLLSKEPSAYTLLVAPRLAYTLLSFVVDLCLYKLCQYYSSRGLWYLPVSVIFQTSFVCVGCLTRTLSNTPEVVIFALLLVVVCQTIRPRFRILFVTPTRSTPANERVKGSTQLLSSISVGILITIGLFNRPTFPCFALIPGVYWAFESLRRNSNDLKLTVQRVMIPLAISSAVTALCISAYDTAYYKGYSTLKYLFDCLIESRFMDFYIGLRSTWVVTPYNFVAYNTNVSNLSKYGIHLPYTHMLVNVPLAFNILGLMFYGRLISLLDGSIHRFIFSTHRFSTLMLSSTLASMILLSFIPHQEFRFLLPLIVPLTYVFAFNIYTSNRLTAVWLLINFTLLYFYSSVHQAGVTRACLDLDPLLKPHSSGANIQSSQQSMVTVVAFRCYSVPSYQWNLKNIDSRYQLDLQDTFEDFESSVKIKLGRVVERHLKSPQFADKVFIMLPRVYEDQLVQYIQDDPLLNSSKLATVHNYSPHFSGEDLQMSIRLLRRGGLKEWRKAFGFSLIQLEISGQ